MMQDFKKMVFDLEDIKSSKSDVYIFENDVLFTDFLKHSNTGQFYYVFRPKVLSVSEVNCVAYKNDRIALSKVHDVDLLWMYF